MSLPFDFSATMGAFKSPLPVMAEDFLGWYEDGVWKKEKTGERNIPAIVLALSLQQLQLYGEGNIVDGGIAVWTREEFFISDPKQSDIEGRQTIVIYQGRRYRAVGDGLVSGGASLTGNMNVNVYHCLRYFE